MAISASDRFNRGLLATTKFQADERKDRENKDLAKLENIRKYQHTINQRVEDEKARLSQRDLSKVKAVGLAQWSYEHVINIFQITFSVIFCFLQRCHLKNNWN